MLDSLEPMLIYMIFPINTLEFLSSKYHIILKEKVQVVLEFLLRQLVIIFLNKSYFSSKIFHMEPEIINKLDTGRCIVIMDISEE